MMTNNKDILKNSIALYLRMILLLAISLFTSREILKYLGIVDYGIYNVVAGVVSIVSFFSSTLQNSTQRFFNVALGSADKNISESFKASIVAHFLLALVLFLSMETVGLWFVENKLTIPSERMEAALWAFHTAIFIMISQITREPFNALIISYERMSAFAYISIIEAGFKLLVVYCLIVIPYDKLKVYSVLSLFFQMLILIACFLYVRYKLPRINYHCKLNFTLLKEMGKFVAWSSYGGISIIGYTQGLNILLNMFFGPVVNAARGLAVQLQGILTQFRSNFQVAVNPQLVQSYAEGNDSRFLFLLSFSCRFSTYIMLAMSVPFIFRVQWILDLWLYEVPAYTSSFLKIILLACIMDSSAGPFVMGIQANGNIKWHEIVTGTLQLLILPAAYLFLKLGYSPNSVFWILLAFTTLSHCCRLFIFVKLLKMNFIDLYTIYNRIILVLIFSFFMGWLVDCITPQSIIYNILYCGGLFFCVLLLSFLFGLKDNEQEKIKRFVLSVFLVKK